MRPRHGGAFVAAPTLGAAARGRTRVALERMVEPYRTSDGGLELPVAAKLASGGKR